MRKKYDHWIAFVIAGLYSLRATRRGRFSSFFLGDGGRKHDCHIRACSTVILGMDDGRTFCGQVQISVALSYVKRGRSWWYCKSVSILALPSQYVIAGYSTTP